MSPKFPRHGRRTLFLWALANSVWAGTPVLVIDNPAVPRPNAYFVGDAFLANDHVPLADFAADPWPGGYRTRSGDNVSLASVRASFGAAGAGFSVEYLRRSEALLTASGDTAHVLYLAQTDQLFSSARALAIDYNFKGFEADGVRFGMQGSASLASAPTSWGVAANFLRGLRLRDESAHARYSSNGSTASLHGRRELWYSELRPSSRTGLSAFHPFSEQPVAAHGAGWAIDLGVAHAFAGGLRFTAAINDLGGRIKWRQVPHMRQDFAIDEVSPSSYASNGTALVSGYHDYRDHTMRLHRKYLAKIEAPLTREWGAHGELRRTGGQDFPGFGMRWNYREGRALAIDYDARWRSVGIAAAWPHVSIALRSDDLNLGRSRALGVHLAAAYNF